MQYSSYVDVQDCNLITAYIQEQCIIRQNQLINSISSDSDVCSCAFCRRLFMHHVTVNGWHNIIKYQIYLDSKLLKITTLCPSTDLLMLRVSEKEIITAASNNCIINKLCY